MLVVYCLSVTLTKTSTGSPSGIVLPNSVYKSNHGGASFKFMRDMCADYDPSIKYISNDDRALMMRGLEHSCAAGTSNQSRIQSIKVGACNLILANVELTWVKELSFSGAFYTSAAFCAVLVHLEKDGTALDLPAGVELVLGLHKLWEANPRVRQFIINMEEAQKKSVRAQLPITDEILAAFAAFMLLKSNAFPRDRPVWDGKPVVEQLWS